MRGSLREGGNGGTAIQYVPLILPNPVFRPSHKDLSIFKDVLSRRVQVSWKRSQYQQTDRDRSTQTDWASDVELGGEGRIVLPSAEYETAERYVQTRARSVLLLQRAVRAWIFTRRERREQALAEEEEEDDFFPEEDQAEAPAVMM